MVSDQDRGILSLGKVNQHPSVSNGVGYRLFNQNRDAPLERSPGCLMMELRWRCNDQTVGLDAIKQILN